MKTGATLRAVMSALGGPVTGLVAAPGGLDVELRAVVIAEPGDPVGPGDLVLVAGARGEAAVPVIEAAAGCGAAAVAVKGTPVEAMRQAGIAVLSVAAGARWDQVETLARAAIEGAGGDSHQDLFSLAQTVATLTGGAVTIEDTAHRVLAYSESDDDVDELRRQSILGRNCPESYLAHLREWGVYQRLWAGEEVVDVAERPDLGVRRRLVIGVHAGSRPLGSIWVQEGRAPLAGRGVEVLRGASRLAALHLARLYGGAATARTEQDLAVGLLTGRFDSEGLARHLGVDPGTPTAVIAVDLRERPDRSWLELRRTQATEIISVHAAAYRRDAMVIPACGLVYILLPDPAGATLSTWTTDLVAALRRHLGTPVQAAVSGVAAHVSEVPRAKKEGSRILEIIASAPERLMATVAEVRSSIVLGDMLDVLRGSGLHDPTLDALEPELAHTLLAYLDAFGDVAAAAEVLHVHPNTVRHRMRRAGALTGLDLSDPEQRLVAMIQLRLGS
ncbi:DNA-binding PucR family transcriptional regulator [Nonomuraea thailandensis]|uniref:DNA-binding PucR family transcriptional regulator n=1 Tax=Nonomuraea thailandensis TaxID=1188745 RepID=A0A9X2GWC7_9ACTN|nr:PucR family transcriptional regulator [Nonomuraea thailandensis]MCP2365105.1 DNA-binding PucR family transcriptional regulator [Nonomuraea thailandensis]